MKEEFDKIRIKPYSLKEMAEIYGVHFKTLKKWIAPYKEKIGKRIGRFYNTLQVRKILKYLGLPSRLDLD